MIEWHAVAKHFRMLLPGMLFGFVEMSTLHYVNCALMGEDLRVG